MPRHAERRVIPEHSGHTVGAEPGLDHLRRHEIAGGVDGHQLDTVEVRVLVVFDRSCLDDLEVGSGELFHSSGGRTAVAAVHHDLVVGRHQMPDAELVELAQDERSRVGRHTPQIENRSSGGDEFGEPQFRQVGGSRLVRLVGAIVEAGHDQGSYRRRLDELLATAATVRPVTDPTHANPNGYDSIVLMSFGGPNGPDDVIPFLENVTRGRGVPRERLEEVAEQYTMFGGKSPINEQNQELLAALRIELDAHGIELPLYWGNRNWDPFISDTAAEMVAAGHQRALAVVTSAFSSYSGCRQYREDFGRATDSVDGALTFHKIRAFWHHPGYIETMTDRVAEAVDTLPDDARASARIVYTAHSLPNSMAATSDYVAQLEDAAALVTDAARERTGLELEQVLVFQSRSGPPQVPWLEPDIVDHLRDSVDSGDLRPVVVVPIGFISDHQEVKFDLDTQAREVADELGLSMVRAGTAGIHPRFVAMLRELIEERLGDDGVRVSIGELPARPDQCPQDCCPAPQRPAGAGRPGRPG